MQSAGMTARIAACVRSGTVPVAAMARALSAAHH